MTLQFWLGLAIFPGIVVTVSLALLLWQASRWLFDKVDRYFWETIPLTKYGDFRKLVPDNLPDGLYNMIVTLFLSPKIRTLCLPGWQIVFVRQYKIEKYKEQETIGPFGKVTLKGKENAG